MGPQDEKDLLKPPPPPRSLAPQKGLQSDQDGYTVDTPEKPKRKGITEKFKSLQRQASGLPEGKGITEKFKSLQRQASGLPEMDAAPPPPSILSKPGAPSGANASSPPTPFSKVGSNIDQMLNYLRPGFMMQESSGNFRAQNEFTNATGLFQVMPSNIADWTKEALGYSMTQQQFKYNPEAQTKVFNHFMRKYLDQASRKSNDPETIMRMAAAAWYGGPGNMHLYKTTHKQKYNGPSFWDYGSGVLKKAAKYHGDRPFDLPGIEHMTRDQFLVQDAQELPSLYGAPQGTFDLSEEQKYAMKFGGGAPGQGYSDKPLPPTTHNGITYKPRAIEQGEPAFDFERTGKFGKLTYLGMDKDEHWFKDETGALWRGVPQADGSIMPKAVDPPAEIPLKGKDQKIVKAEDQKYTPKGKTRYVNPKSGERILYDHQTEKASREPMYADQPIEKMYQEYLASGGVDQAGNQVQIEDNFENRKIFEEALSAQMYADSGDKEAFKRWKVAVAESDAEYEQWFEQTYSDSQPKARSQYKVRAYDPSSVVMTSDMGIEAVKANIVNAFKTRHGISRAVTRNYLDSVEGNLQWLGNGEKVRTTDFVDRNEQASFYYEQPLIEELKKQTKEAKIKATGLLEKKLAADLSQGRTAPDDSTLDKFRNLGLEDEEVMAAYGMPKGDDLYLSEYGSKFKEILEKSPELKSEFNKKYTDLYMNQNMTGEKARLVALKELGLVDDWFEWNFRMAKIEDGERRLQKAMAEGGMTQVLLEARAGLNQLSEFMSKALPTVGSIGLKQLRSGGKVDAKTYQKNAEEVGKLPDYFRDMVTLDDKEVAEITRNQMEALFGGYNTTNVIDYERKLEEYAPFRGKLRLAMYGGEFTKSLIKAIPQTASSMLKAYAELKQVPIPLANTSVYLTDPVDIAYALVNAPSYNIWDMSEYAKNLYTLDAPDTWSHDLGDAIDITTETLLPGNPDFQQSMMLTTIPNVVGQVITQVGLGIATGGVAAPVAAGMAMGIAEQAEAQREAGVTPQNSPVTVIGGRLVAGVAAASDYFLMNRFLSPILKNSGATDGAQKFLGQMLGTVQRGIGLKLGDEIAEETTKALAARMLSKAWAVDQARKAAKKGGTYLWGGTGEGIQESSEKKANDLWASITYDPDRKIMTIDDEDIQNFLGGFAGGLAGSKIQISLENHMDPKQEEIISAQISPFANMASKEFERRLAELGNELERAKAGIPASVEGIYGGTTTVQVGTKKSDVQDVRIPERKETLEAQVRAIGKGGRQIVVIPNGLDGNPSPNIPELGDNLETAQSAFGTVIFEKGQFNPKYFESDSFTRKDAADMQGLVQLDSEVGTDGQWLLASRGGIELGSAFVSPENVEAQKEKFKEQFGKNIKTEVMTPEQATSKILNDRINAQPEVKTQIEELLRKQAEAEHEALYGEALDAQKPIEEILREGGVTEEELGKTADEVVENVRDLQEQQEVQKAAEESAKLTEDESKEKGFKTEADAWLKKMDQKSKIEEEMLANEAEETDESKAEREYLEKETELGRYTRDTTDNVTGVTANRRVEFVRQSDGMYEAKIRLTQKPNVNKVFPLDLLMKEIRKLFTLTPESEQLLKKFEKNENGTVLGLAFARAIINPKTGDVSLITRGASFKGNEPGTGGFSNIRQIAADKIPNLTAKLKVAPKASQAKTTSPAPEGDSPGGKAVEAADTGKAAPLGTVFTKDDLKGNFNSEGSDLIREQMLPGDEVTFFQNGERKGIFDGQWIVDENKQRVGIASLLREPDTWIQIDSRKGQKGLELWGVEQAVTPKTSQGVPAFISKKREAELKALGYTQEQIDKMKPAAAQDIVEKGIRAKDETQGGVVTTEKDVELRKEQVAALERLGYSKESAEKILDRPKDQKPKPLAKKDWPKLTKKLRNRLWGLRNADPTTVKVESPLEYALMSQIWKLREMRGLWTREKYERFIERFFDEVMIGVLDDTTVNVDPESMEKLVLDYTPAKYLSEMQKPSAPIEKQETLDAIEEAPPEIAEIEDEVATPEEQAALLEEMRKMYKSEYSFELLSDTGNNRQDLTGAENTMLGAIYTARREAIISGEEQEIAAHDDVGLDNPIHDIVQYWTFRPDGSIFDAQSGKVIISPETQIYKRRPPGLEPTPTVEEAAKDRENLIEKAVEVVKEPKQKALEYNPTTLRHNGEMIKPGDILVDEGGQEWVVERNLGYTIRVDAIGGRSGTFTGQTRVFDFNPPNPDVVYRGKGNFYENMDKKPPGFSIRVVDENGSTTSLDKTYSTLSRAIKRAEMEAVGDAEKGVRRTYLIDEGAADGTSTAGVESVNSWEMPGYQEKAAADDPNGPPTYAQRNKMIMLGMPQREALDIETYGEAQDIIDTLVEEIEEAKRQRTESEKQKAAATQPKEFDTARKQSAYVRKTLTDLGIKQDSISGKVRVSTDSTLMISDAENLVMTPAQAKELGQIPGFWVADDRLRVAYDPKMRGYENTPAPKAPKAPAQTAKSNQKQKIAAEVSKVMKGNLDIMERAQLLWMFFSGNLEQKTAARELLGDIFNEEERADFDADLTAENLWDNLMSEIAEAAGFKVQEINDIDIIRKAKEIASEAWERKRAQEAKQADELEKIKAQLRDEFKYEKDELREINTLADARDMLKIEKNAAKTKEEDDKTAQVEASEKKGYYNKMDNVMRALGKARQKTQSPKGVKFEFMKQFLTKTNRPVDDFEMDKILEDLEESGYIERLPGDHIRMTPSGVEYTPQGKTNKKTKKSAEEQESAPEEMYKELGAQLFDYLQILKKNRTPMPTRVGNHMSSSPIFERILTIAQAVMDPAIDMGVAKGFFAEPHHTEQYVNGLFHMANDLRAKGWRWEALQLDRLRGVVQKAARALDGSFTIKFDGDTGTYVHEKGHEFLWRFGNKTRPVLNLGTKRKVGWLYTKHIVTMAKAFNHWYKARYVVPFPTTTDQMADMMEEIFVEMLASGGTKMGVTHDAAVRFVRDYLEAYTDTNGIEIFDALDELAEQMHDHLEAYRDARKEILNYGKSRQASGDTTNQEGAGNVEVGAGTDPTSTTEEAEPRNSWGVKFSKPDQNEQTDEKKGKVVQARLNARLQEKGFQLSTISYEKHIDSQVQNRAKIEAAQLVKQGGLQALIERARDIMVMHFETPGGVTSESLKSADDADSYLIQIAMDQVEGMINKLESIGTVTALEEAALLSRVLNDDLAKPFTYLSLRAGRFINALKGLRKQQDVMKFVEGFLSSDDGKKLTQRERKTMVVSALKTKAIIEEKKRIQQAILEAEAETEQQLEQMESPVYGEETKKKVSKTIKEKLGGATPKDKLAELKKKIAADPDHFRRLIDKRMKNESILKRSAEKMEEDDLDKTLIPILEDMINNYSTYYPDQKVFDLDVILKEIYDLDPRLKVDGYGEKLLYMAKKQLDVDRITAYEERVREKLKEEKPGVSENSVEFKIELEARLSGKAQQQRLKSLFAKTKKLQVPNLSSRELKQLKMLEQAADGDPILADRLERIWLRQNKNMTEAIFEPVQNKTPEQMDDKRYMSMKEAREAMGIIEEVKKAWKEQDAKLQAAAAGGKRSLYKMQSYLKKLEREQANAELPFRLAMKKAQAGRARVLYDELKSASGDLRALMAAADLSGAFRQGFWLMLYAPTVANMGTGRTVMPDRFQPTFRKFKAKMSQRVSEPMAQALGRMGFSSFEKAESMFDAPPEDMLFDPPEYESIYTSAKGWFKRRKEFWQKEGAMKSFRTMLPSERLITDDVQSPWIAMMKSAAFWYTEKGKGDEKGKKRYKVGEVAYQQAIAEIENNPMFEIWVDQMGIDFSVAGKSLLDPTFGEEVVSTRILKQLRVPKELSRGLSNWLEKKTGKRILPQLLRDRDLPLFPWLDWSERTWAAFLDTQRAAVARAWTIELLEMGIDPMTEQGKAAFGAMGYIINIMSGRSDLRYRGKVMTDVDNAIKGLNFFFAPSYAVSRFQVLAHQVSGLGLGFGDSERYSKGWIRSKAVVPNDVRSLIRRKTARTNSIVIGALSLLTKLGLSTFNWDDDDFLKLKIPNIDPWASMTSGEIVWTKSQARYGILGGMTPYAKLVVRSGIKIPAGLMSTAFPDSWDPPLHYYGFTNEIAYTAQRFLRGKASPSLSFWADLIYGVDYIGRDTSLKADDAWAWRTFTGSSASFDLLMDRLIEDNLGIEIPNTVKYYDERSKREDQFFMDSVILNRVIPLFISEQIQGFGEEGLLGNVLLAPGFLGFQASLYPDYLTQFNDPDRKDLPAFIKMRDLDARNAWNAYDMFIDGMEEGSPFEVSEQEKKALIVAMQLNHMKAKKPETKAIYKKALNQYGLPTLPSVELPKEAQKVLDELKDRRKIGDKYRTRPPQSAEELYPDQATDEP